MSKKKKKVSKKINPKIEATPIIKKQVFWEKHVVERNWFFPLFQKVIRSVSYPKVHVNVETDKGLFRFLFRWQDEDTCGIEVFKKVILNG
jgi:hypothetical protein